MEQALTRNTVSVWMYTPVSRGVMRTKEIEHLKRDVTTLSRLRHPCILEVVEPLEECRSSYLFATEHVVASSHELLQDSADPAHQLDEVELQKGFLQLARALDFLHDAKLVHTNLTSMSVVMNAKGDWKLCGCAYLTSLAGLQSDGGRWAYEEEEHALPEVMRRDMDFADPVYVIDRRVGPYNDMYSLGILFYMATHHSAKPYQTYGSASALSAYMEDWPQRMYSSTWSLLERDVQTILTRLLSRTETPRYTAKAFLDLPYLNSMLVRVLKFLERESFAAHSRTEKVQFLRGMYKMLPQFSVPLMRRKLLPNLLEATSDRMLLPYILPNVFYIAKNLSQIEFTTTVLVRLEPHFCVHEPAQSQMLLLNQTDLFLSKTTQKDFQTRVMPLLYSAFDNEHVAVQENALQRIPKLCETLDYTHVKDILLPKLTSLFSKTKTLSVKVTSLICFHAMIPMLDKTSITDVLLPTLNRIKTREPSVMVGSLAVFEALCDKVDLETKATVFLPRLWIMAMCPLLNEMQFGRFMRAIKDIGQSVEQKQLERLREAKHLQLHTEEQASKTIAPVPLNAAIAATGDIDLEALVGHARYETSVHAMDDLFAPDSAQPRSKSPVVPPPPPSGTLAPPPGWSGGLLVPDSVPRSKTPRAASKAQWHDFDPLL